MGDRGGRKPILVAGWLFAMPVPLLIIFAPSWGWVVFANVLLGINQGLAWSTTVIMKIDLVGPRQRGLAPGIYTPGFLGTNLHGYRTINYSDQELNGIPGNGIFQGYRWFDINDYTPLFPFGHGLSYTEFAYSDLSVRPAGDGLDVSFVVKNVGDVAGAEVPQVYVGAPFNAPVPMAEKALAGFERIELAPGESKQVQIHVGERELSYWSVEKHDWVVPSTFRPIYVGASSRDIRLEKVVHDWSGFRPPVSGETPNQAKAGQTVPVKFSLNGDYGLSAVVEGYPLYQPLTCDSNEPEGDAVPAFSVAGLQYDPAADQYIFTWKTEKQWAGSYGRIDFLLNDGTVHSAIFLFK